MDIARELRLAGRSLLRSRLFALVSIATIALGIGATTTVFSLVNALLLRPLPIAEPGRVVGVQETLRGMRSMSMGYSAVSYPRYVAYREASAGIFSGLAAQRYEEMSLRATGQAQVLTGVVASGNYWEVLGVRPALGRFFTGPDEKEQLAVISHHLWQTRFGGDPGVVGRTVHLDSRPLSVVGVAPKEFGGTLVGGVADVWVTLGAAGIGRANEAINSNPGASLILFGRLRPGMTQERAGAALKVAAARVPLEEPNARVLDVRLEPLTGVPGDMRMPVAGFMGLLLATALFVLLIAGTNVAGMLLARAVARRREMAIRLAVGATGRNLVRQLLGESVLLFLLGGGAGVVLTIWLTRMLSSMQPPFPTRIAFDLRPDPRVLGFALALALLTGVAFGLMPALQASRTDVLSGLKDGGTREGARRGRLRSGLVVGQLALAMLLMLVAGLFARTLQHSLSADPGFVADDVAVARVDLEPHGYDRARGEAFQRRLLERVAAAPGVRSATLADFAPMSGNVRSEELRLPGKKDAITVSIDAVDPGFFATLQIPLRAGRVFTDADRAGAPPVVVINQTLAQRLWPGASALGRTVRLGDGPPVEVVGVVANGTYERFGERPVSFLYRPVAQNYSPGVTIMARADRGAGAALEAIRRELQGMDANVAPEQAMPLTSMIGVSLFPQRIAAFFIGGFGVLGLLLACIGIYGVLAYQVGQRTREIGVRVALGARAGDVVRMMVRHGFKITALGAAIGVVMAVAATRLLSSPLYGVSATDPLTFTAVPVLLLAVALVASWLPARRAARVDPMVALRAE
ncbi:MAG TPA: ABC transporter permease [Longimicrobium sp.]|jgi:predicted permease